MQVTQQNSLKTIWKIEVIINMSSNSKTEGYTGFPGGPLVLDSVFAWQRAQVQFPVGELRSCMPPGTAPKKVKRTAVGPRAMPSTK